MRAGLGNSLGRSSRLNWNCLETLPLHYSVYMTLLYWVNLSKRGGTDWFFRGLAGLLLGDLCSHFGGCAVTVTVQGHIWSILQQTYHLWVAKKRGWLKFAKKYPCTVTVIALPSEWLHSHRSQKLHMKDNGPRFFVLESALSEEEKKVLLLG